MSVMCHDEYQVNWYNLREDEGLEIIMDASINK